MAGKIVVHVSEVRDFISEMKGVAEIAALLPAYLDGRNSEHRSVWLTKEDLGGWDPFETSWRGLCDNRLEEAEEMAGFFPELAVQLERALEKHTGTDEEIAATFPAERIPGTSKYTESLDDVADRHGLGHVSRHERLSRNVPE